MMRKAFSLMELMIVIIILGLLAALVMPNLVGKGEQAKQKLVCVQMKTISESIKMFRIDTGAYPTLEDGIGALMNNPDPARYTNYPTGGYLDGKNEPKDPWGGNYIYVLDGGDFDLISLGANRQEGGDGEAKDIYYSQCQ